MRPLVDDMTHTDPSVRPTMDEVVARYQDIRKQLTTRKLRSGVPAEFPGDKTFRESVWGKWKRTMYFIKGVSPLPVPATDGPLQ